MKSQFKTFRKLDKIELRNKIVLTVFEITEKVSFNIASEASYVYSLSGQKLIKNAILWKYEACG